jgi:hypothetical protein
MIGYRRVFRDVLASLAAVILTLACASTLSGQVSAFGLANPPAMAGPIHPSTVPEEYVITPFGYFHPSCTRLVAEGETVLPDGRIQHADGSVDANAPVCSYPHYTSTGSLVSDVQGMSETCIPGGSSWVESVGATPTAPTTSYGKITATWTVPPAPSSNDGQTLFFFPGFEDCGNTLSILQPVLQYGVSAAGGGNYWAIASWNCCITDVTWYSPLVNVSPGHTLLGTISSTCKPGGNSCPTWNVVTEDKSTGGKTTLPKTSPHNQVWNWAFGGVLEVYNIQQCSDYPANGDVVFNVTLYDQNRTVISNPGWTGNPAGSGITPQCGFVPPNVSAKKETLSYAYGPGTIQSLTCTAEPYGFLVTVKGTLQGPEGAAYTMTWADINGNDWTNPFYSCSPWTLGQLACTNNTGKFSTAKYVYEIGEFQPTNVTVTLHGGFSPVTASVSCP